MSLWDSIKSRLGLEDEYDYDYEDEDERFEDRRRESGPYSEPLSVKRVNRQPDIERARDMARNVAHITSVESPQLKMFIAEPRTFGEAQSIADRFKQDMPVILNLTATDPELAKRILDFASGLTYGLGGGLQKVSERVFMLTPANVDVSAADRRRLRDKGLFTIDA